MKITTFRKLDLLPPSDKNGEDTNSICSGPLRLLQCRYPLLLPEYGGRIIRRNFVRHVEPDNEQRPYNFPVGKG
jgi:hypothetical protein